MQAYLILANGRVFRGVSVGCPGTTIGEVVFATGMVGFEETLTDPSYYGQIITQTYPLIGNYGMNSEDVESTKIWARGYIVREACKTPSNFRSEETLDAFLKKNGIIGIEGIDTRSLTRTLRESGVMNGAITTEFDPDAEPEKKAALLPEIAAYAVGNVAAGLVGCCVVSGSVSRTAVNERNGGKTQLVSVTASVTMLLVLLFATPLIRFLPVPVLTAIVVNALIGATEFGIARRLWRVNRVELGIFTGAFLGVLLLGAIKGVLVGMVLSFVDVLMRAAAPQRTFLGTLPGKSGFFPIDRVSGVQPLPHIVLYRFSGSLFFANIRRFQEDIEGALQPDTQAVIVDGSAVVSVDITACDRLVALNRKLRAQGVRFYLTEHIGEVNDQLRHFEAGELIETGAVRRTIRGALRDAGVTLDPGSSYQKIPGNMDDIRQLQELEWLYGADAEVQIERNVQLMLARMRTTDDVRARRAMLEHFLNEDFHFGSIDADEVLLHLEGHTDELAELLENSEDDVFTDLEVERDSLIDRVEQDYPELVEHVRERRDHLDHDFHTNHPSSAARIDARPQQLRARIERERAERGERRAQHQAELLERHEQHAAAHQERHEQHATEQQLRHERQLEERLRRQAEQQVAREQRQAAELAKKAQRAAERARRHAEHSAERAQKHAEDLARKMQRHAEHKAERLERHAEHKAKHEQKRGSKD